MNVESTWKLEEQREAIGGLSSCAILKQRGTQYSRDFRLHAEIKFRWNTPCFRLTDPKPHGIQPDEIQ